MPIPAQRLQKIEVTKLKGINNLVLEMGSKPLTAIMGVNGCGKSTILHALACCYKPYNGHDSYNHKFSEYFTPNSDSRWNGSHFKIHYNHDLAAGVHVNSRVYKKVNQRWSPRYTTRLSRWVSYIGIKHCVPIIEQLKDISFIRLVSTPRLEQIWVEVRQHVSFVLNRNYTAITSNIRGNDNFIGVNLGGIQYSAISMGSGEQRVFKIFEQVVKAPNYGLILIDEIELLMHTDALNRMIRRLNEIAVRKSLQIIFTTHSEAVLGLTAYVDVRHIYIAEDRNAYSLHDANPKFLYSLTGNAEQILKVFVEDELSKEIVNKVAKSLGIKKDVQVGIFGPAINCFTAVAGAILTGNPIQDCLFVIDGDLYVTREEKKTRLNAVLTGTDMRSKRRKVTALQQISQLTLPGGYKPEQYLHEQIINEPPNPNQQFNEIRDAAIHIQAVDDSHKFIDDIVERLGYEQNDFRDIVECLSTLPFWNGYTENLRTWMAGKIREHNL